MNSTTAIRRFRLVSLLALTAVLAIGSLWLNMVLKRSAVSEQAGMPRVDPDYYMDKFRYFKLKITGEPEYEMSGKKMTHYPDNDSYLVKFPVMESLDKQKRLQVVYSDWSFIEDENSKIHMHENVVVFRAPTPKTAAFRMTTDYMLVLPDEDIMRTDQPVTAYQGTSTMNGIGMESNNATREVFLFNRAKVVYPPAKPKNNQGN